MSFGKHSNLTEQIKNKISKRNPQEIQNVPVTEAVKKCHYSLIRFTLQTYC